MFPAVFAGRDSHIIIIHILFHTEISYIKLLNGTFVTDGHLGGINCVVRLLMKDRLRQLLSLTVGCARACSAVVLTHLLAQILALKCYSEARKLSLSVFRTVAPPMADV